MTRSPILAVAVLALVACSDPSQPPPPELTELEIGGVITNHEGDPAPGVNVRLTIFGPAGTAEASGVTDEGGSFLLPIGLPGGCRGEGSFIVWFAAAGRGYVAQTMGGDGTLKVGCEAAAQLPELALVQFATSIPQRVVGLTGVTRVFTGWNTSCAIAAGGAHCWGDGWRTGEGVAQLPHSTTPVPVTGGSAFTYFASLTEGACTLDAEGATWCWNGVTTWGEFPSVDGPEPVRLDTDLRFVQVGLGALHGCGLTAEGKVYCWGDARASGVPDRPSGYHPPGPPIASDRRFVQLDVGPRLSCALDDQGDVWCWGFSYHGEMGDGGTHGWVHAPVRVASDLHFVAVAVGEVHGCALAQDGSAHCWGYAARGAVGTGQMEMESVTSPVPVAGGHSFAGISAAPGITCAWKADGSAYCWGRDDYLQLGAAEVDGQCSMPPRIPPDFQPGACSSAPVRVQGSHSFTSVSAGGYSSCGVTVEGHAYCWGRRAYLGAGLD